MAVKVISFYDKVDLKPNKESGGLVPVYETIETDKGLVYKKINSINRQAIMNSQAKNCDINVIYKKLIRGDNSVLNTREGVFLNVVNAPKDIYEMNNYSKKVEDYFNNSALLKSVYNSDFNAYFKDYNKGLDVVKTKIDSYSLGIINNMSKKADIKENKKSEVKENENK